MLRRFRGTSVPLETCRTTVPESLTNSRGGELKMDVFGMVKGCCVIMYKGPVHSPV